MKGIQTIKIRNFKAFSKQEEIKLNGKNLLVYGENGSGKSSLYFAIYTFLQCSIKGKKFKKYFSRKGKESLINIYTSTEDSFIEMTANEEGRAIEKFRLSATQNNLRRQRFIPEMNLASDFISHRLLINFYNYRNSSDINLTSVFERDIFPYFTLTTSEGTEYFSDVFDRLKNELPVNIVRGKKVPIAQTSQRFIKYENLLNKFNDELDNLLQQINSQVSNYYAENFNENKDELQIFVELKEKLNINSVINKIELNTPFIRLFVKQKFGSEYKTIHRPQSFLNEAKLTAIALSIRFVLLERRPNQLIPTKILALDDLLVSLDMSHRETVLKLLLKKYASKYQLIVFTHDRQFFYMAKSNIKLYHDSKEWSFIQMYADDRKGFERPYITEFQNNLEKAEGFMLAFQFSAAANSLRSELEEFLHNLIPLEEQVDTNGFQIKDFSLIDKAVVFLKKCGAVITDFELLKKHKDVSLNPLSHFDIERQIYRKELDDCIKLIRKIENEFKNFKAKKILKPNDELNFQLMEGATVHQFTVTLKDRIYLYTKDGTAMDLTTTPLKVEWLKNGLKQPHKINKSNLTALLNEACHLTHNPTGQDPFAVYQLPDGNLLSTLRTL